MDRPRIEDAFALAARGDDAGAADVLAALAAATPAHATVHVLLARACEALHRWPEALASWQTARLLLPESALAEAGALRAARVLAALQTMADGVAFAYAPVAIPPEAAPEAAPLADAVADLAAAPASEAPPLADTAAPASEDVPDDAGSPEDAEAPGASEADPLPAEPDDVLPTDDEASADPPPAGGETSGEDEQPAAPAAEDAPFSPPEPPGSARAAEAAPPLERPSAPFDPFAAARPALVWAPIAPRPVAAPPVPEPEAPEPSALERPPPGAETAVPEERLDAGVPASLGLPAPGDPPASRFEGAGDPFDLDSLIDSLNAAGRMQPRADVDSIPPPAGLDDDDADDLVSETLARIYAGQGQFAEAARVYEQLARQQPAQRDRLLAEADALRARAKK